MPQHVGEWVHAGVIETCKGNSLRDLAMPDATVLELSSQEGNLAFGLVKAAELISRATDEHWAKKHVALPSALLFFGSFS